MVNPYTSAQRANLTARLLREQLLKPSVGVRRCSLAQNSSEEANWTAGQHGWVAARPEKKTLAWKKNTLAHRNIREGRRQFP